MEALHLNYRTGEVVEASTREFTAQCFDLFQPPPLGSLVKTGDEGKETFAIVCEAATTSIDPSRKPIALGKEAAAEEAIYRDHPQLAQLLRTDFRALVVGYRERGAIRQYLPALPARVHSFVYLCQDEEVKEFTSSLDFLALVADGQVPNRDEVLGAFLRAASKTQQEPEGFLIHSGKVLAALMARDTTRLNSLLKRIRP